MTKVYVSSKIQYADMWKRLRELVGFNINSSWIDVDGPDIDFSELWPQMIEEAASADCLIAYRQQDEVWKGAYIEIGAALANNVPIYLVDHHIGTDTFHYHPSVKRFDDIEQVVMAIETEFGEHG